MDGVAELVDKGFFVVVLVAVGLVGGDFPSGGVGVDVKLGELVLDTDLLEFGLRLDLVAKGYSVVKNTKTQRKDTFRVSGFGKIERGLIIGVLYKMIFAPGHLDGFGMLLFDFAD